MQYLNSTKFNLENIFAGLLSPPTGFRGQPLPNNLEIHLTWGAPPSLDLTGIDPDIMNYEISVFLNETGESENFTTLHTEYTYLVRQIHSADLCHDQDLEFSVLALNVVGRGSKSTLNVAPREGNSNNNKLKLIFVIVIVIVN
jgi:hypothetical protein